MEKKFVLLVFIVASFVVQVIAEKHCYSCVYVTRQVNERKRRDISDFWNDVKNLFNDIKSTVEGLVQKIEDNVDIKGVMDEISKNLDQILEKVNLNPDSINLESAKNILNQLIESSKKHLDDFSPEVREKIDELLSDMAKRAESAGDFGKELIETGVVPAGLKALSSCDDPFLGEGVDVCTLRDGMSCGKIKVTVRGVDTITRSCVPSVVCNAENFNCCDSHKCNSALRISTTYLPLILIVSVAKLLV